MAKKVLVVEDETPLRDALESKFELDGFSVTVAQDGEEGLKLALKNHPDMILLDIIMPKMDGLTMLKQLRENAWGKTVKVIIITNLASWDETHKAVNYNIHEYLVKSDWKIEDVVKMVKKKLDVL